MPSSPSSQIFLCLSFILFLDTTMSEKYKAGKSATISCSAPPNHDFRELSFYKGTSRLFTIWISSDKISNTLEVSGTYNDFTWISNQDGRKPYPCTNANSEGSTAPGCRDTESTDTKIYLSDGEEDMASLSIDSNYKSRIWLSGTILNATITLSGLVKEDEGCYSCRWKEFNVPDLIRGKENCLDIENPPDNSTGKCIGYGILIGVIAFLIGLGIGYLLLYFFYDKKRRQQDSHVPICYMKEAELSSPRSQ